MYSSKVSHVNTEKNEKLQLSLFNPITFNNLEKKYSCSGPLNLFQFVASSITFFGRRFRSTQTKRNDVNAIQRIKYIKIPFFSHGHNLSVVSRVVLHRRRESLPT